MIGRLVVFGGTGDLSGRYLFPALAALLERRYLPEGFEVVGASREDLDDEQFRSWASDWLQRETAAVDAGRLALEPAGRPLAVLLVAPLVAAGAHELEALGEVSAGLERGEAGKQEAAREVTRATEDDEPIDHVRPVACHGPRLAAGWAARASVTPAAITPM